MIYTIKDALDDATSWDIGTEVAVIARIEHLISGEIREVTFKEGSNIEAAIEQLDGQGYAITCYNDENMFHRECSSTFDELMTQIEEDACS